jgi:hypothetical protein
VVSILANGTPVGSTVSVPPFQTITFGGQASDPDGLGFPVFAFLGIPTPVTFIWNFGGITPSNGALAIFGPSPAVMFPAPSDPNGPSATFPVSLTAFDALGNSTTRSFSVIVGQNPSVGQISANGDQNFPLSPIPGGLMPSRFRIGQPVQLEVDASDSDGLGFPIFAGLGVSTPISFLWDFGGGQGSNPLAIFQQNPVVTFNLNPGEDIRVFKVSVTVFDSLGFQTSSQRDVIVERSGPPVVNVFVNGVNLGNRNTIQLPNSQFSQPIQLGAKAFDEDGLAIQGAVLGMGIFFFTWEFPGAAPVSPLAGFSPNPIVRALDPNLEFTARVRVVDTTGQITFRSFRVLPGGQ